MTDDRPLTPEQLADLEARREAGEVTMSDALGVLAEDAAWEIERQLMAPRGRGRSAWDDEGILFGRHWRKALREGRLPAHAKAGDVAPFFEGLDRVRGSLSADQVRRLHRRYAHLPRAHVVEPPSAPAVEVVADEIGRGEDQPE
jgi:hypothetical protein